MPTAKSEHINELAAALAKAQGQMQPAKMDAINPFLHNKYADLGSVIQAARTPLSANGLSFTQHPTIENSRVSVCTILMHSSGQWVESVIDLPIGEEKGLSLAQSMGKVVTYLRRYALAAILGIYADEDVDGNDAKTTPKPAARPAQQPPAPAQPANGNGNGHTPAEPPADMPLNHADLASRWPADAKVSYDLARETISSDGTPYLEIPIDKLSHMINQIDKTIRANNLPEEKRAELQLKRDVIHTILRVHATA